MKALTLTQPWATLVAIGAKRVETRSWSTKYRGPIAIHAAKNLDPVGGQAGLIRLCEQTEPFRTALRDYRRIHLGGILAVAELVDVLPTGDHTLSRVRTHGANDWELDFGDYSPNRYAWFLGNVQRIEPPINARGAQGLWTVDEPLASFLAARVGCTGLAASWCPIHGDCLCPRNDDGEPVDGLNHPRCPLHSPESIHAAGAAA